LLPPEGGRGLPRPRFLQQFPFPRTAPFLDPPCSHQLFLRPTAYSPFLTGEASPPVSLPLVEHFISPPISLHPIPRGHQNCEKKDGEWVNVFNRGHPPVFAWYPATAGCNFSLGRPLLAGRYPPPLQIPYLHPFLVAGVGFRFLDLFTAGVWVRRRQGKGLTSPPDEPRHDPLPSGKVPLPFLVVLFSSDPAPQIAFLIISCWC